MSVSGSGEVSRLIELFPQTSDSQPGNSTQSLPAVTRDYIGNLEFSNQMSKRLLFLKTPQGLNM